MKTMLEGPFGILGPNLGQWINPLKLLELFPGQVELKALGHRVSAYFLGSTPELLGQNLSGKGRRGSQLHSERDPLRWFGCAL